MLKQLVSISSSGIFEDFRWDPATPDFERVNLVYGTNGAGKTSLSRALDNLSFVRLGYENASIRLCNADGTNERLSNKSHDGEFERLLVFSDSYVERSHDFDGDTKVSAVLTLGEQTVEDEKRISELRALIERAEEELPGSSTRARAAAKALDTEYTTLAKVIVGALSRAGGAYTSNSNYSSRVVKSRFSGDHSEWKLLSDSDREAALATVNSDERQKIPTRTFSLRIRTDLASQVATALGASPLSEVLDTLKSHSQAASWVETGRDLHADLSRCVFCGGELTLARKDAIERHFSDEVTNLQAEIDDLLAEISGLERGLDSLLRDESVSAVLFSDLRTKFDRARLDAIQEAATLRTWLDKAFDALTQKRKNVVAKVDYEVKNAPSVDGRQLEEAVAAHNTRVEKHATHVQEAARKVELHFLKNSEYSIANIAAKSREALEAQATLEQDIYQHRKDIAALENVEGDPLPSAEVMARELTRILGRNELSFELLADGKHYKVTRHGEPAHGLSTGERTAITLIHFLEAVKRSDTRLGKPIVVIDDPVSSLDSGSAMGISTYIWSEAVSKNHIEQIFLLTHNFELFRQWDIQIDGLPGGRGPKNKKGFSSNSYELIAPYRNVRGVPRRSPKLLAWPPSELARKKIRSSYHHAFLTAARAQTALLEEPSMETKLDALLLYPNVLRRMLETFLAFKSPESVGDFTTSMRAMSESLESEGYAGDADALRLHLTRFTHANSHSESPESNAVVNPDEIDSAIFAVFTFMQATDKRHFEGLCAVLGLDPSQLLIVPPSVSREAV